MSLANPDRSDVHNGPPRALGKRPPGFKRENGLALLPQVRAEESSPRENKFKSYNHQTATKEDHKNLPLQPSKEIMLYPQCTSPAPELPLTWKHAISTTSSLERALDAVSGKKNENQRLEPCPERPNHTGNSIHRPRSRRAKGGMISKYRPKHHQPSTIRDDKSRQNPEVTATRPLLPQFPVKLTGEVSSRATSSKNPDNPPQGDQIQTYTAPEPQRTAVEEALSDLDVFFDYDNSDIKDRDVLRGLQIAVHAAADDTFDALVRHRTGLRIRRFLADLNSVDTLGNGKITEEQPAR